MENLFTRDGNSDFEVRMHRELLRMGTSIQGSAFMSMAAEKNFPLLNGVWDALLSHPSNLKSLYQTSCIHLEPHAKEMVGNIGLKLSSSPKIPATLMLAIPMGKQSTGEEVIENSSEEQRSYFRNGLNALKKADEIDVFGMARKDGSVLLKDQFIGYTVALSRDPVLIREAIDALGGVNKSVYCQQDNTMNPDHCGIGVMASVYRNPVAMNLILNDKESFRNNRLFNHAQEPAFEMLDRFLYNNGKAKVSSSDVILAMEREHKNADHTHQMSMCNAITNLLRPNYCGEGGVIPLKCVELLKPLIHMDLIKECFKDSNGDPLIVKNKAFESLSNIMPSDAKSWYGSSIMDPTHKEFTNHHRLSGESIGQTINLLARNGKYELLSKLSGFIPEAIEDIDKNKPSKVGDKYLIQMMGYNIISSFCNNDSRVPLHDVIKTIDVIVDELRYPLDVKDMNPQTETEKAFKIRAQELLVEIAPKVTKDNSERVFSIMSHLIYKGASHLPETENSPSIEKSLKNKALRDQWKSIIGAINAKNAAMDVLKEFDLDDLFKPN